MFNRIFFNYKYNEKNHPIYELWVSDVNGGEGKPVSTGLNRDLFLSYWMPNGKSLLIGGHNDNKISMWNMSLYAKTTPVDLGSLCPSWSFWMDATISKSGSIAFTGSEPNKPVELYVMTSSTSKAVQLTDYNTKVSKMTLGKTETIYWENDGWKHSGIVTYPVNYEKGKKYPMVLVIHGGPAAASVKQFSRFPQVLSNEGYFVFEPNYRGSDNLGSEYKLAIVQDAGAGPGRDVMGGVEKLKATGMIDADRIGVSGWSYGGFMTV